MSNEREAVILLEKTFRKFKSLGATLQLLPENESTEYYNQLVKELHSIGILLNSVSESSLNEIIPIIIYYIDEQSK